MKDEAERRRRRMTEAGIRDRDDRMGLESRKGGIRRQISRRRSKQG